jgi:hypothetical protein
LAALSALDRFPDAGPALGFFGAAFLSEELLEAVLRTPFPEAVLVVFFLREVGLRAALMGAGR